MFRKRYRKLLNSFDFYSPHEQRAPSSQIEDVKPLFFPYSWSFELSAKGDHLKLDKLS